MTVIRMLIAAAIGTAGCWYFSLVLPMPAALLIGLALALAELAETRFHTGRSAAGALTQAVIVTAPVLLWPGVAWLICPYVLRLPWVDPYPSTVVMVLSAGIASCGVLAGGHDPAKETTRVRAILVALAVVGYASIRTLSAGPAAMSAACLSIAAVLGVTRYALVLPRAHKQALLACGALAALGAVIAAARAAI